MRSIFILCFAIAVGLTPAPSRSAADEGARIDAARIKELCAKRWTGDRGKRNACVKTQNVALKIARSFVKRHNIFRKLRAYAHDAENKKDFDFKFGPYLEIYAECVNRSSKEGSKLVDHVVFSRCLHEEEKAYHASQGIGGPAGLVEAIAMIRKMPNISKLAWAGGDKRNILNVHVHERGQTYATDARAYCDLLKTNGVRGAKVSVWSADANKKSPPKEVLLTHRLC